MEQNNKIKLLSFRNLTREEKENIINSSNIETINEIDDITYTFRYYCNKVAPTNKEQMSMFWYIFLSQFFKNDFTITLGTDIYSPRFSGILIQPSRTGKNYSSDIIYDISKYTNVLEQEKVTSFTENAIIGQVINTNVDYNDKKSLTYPIDKEAKKPFREGIMETTDLIIIEEGKGLFIGGHKENLTRYLQEMTDEKGTVNIGRGAGFFKRQTSCSLMITSVPFDTKDVEKIIDDGFFQRFMLFYKIFTNEEIKEFNSMKEKKELVNSHDFELHKETHIKEKRINENENQLYKLSIEENEQYKKLFARELNKKRNLILDKYKNKLKDGKIIIRFGSFATNTMNDKIKIMINKYKYNMFGNGIEKIDSFQNIVKMITTKIAGINCIMNNRDEIDSGDVKVGLKYAEIHFNSIIHLLSSLESKDNKENIALSRVIGNKWKTEDLVIRKVLTFKKQDSYNAMIRINELVRKNYIERKEDERTGEVKYRCRDVIYELAYSDDDYNEILKQKSKAIKMYNNDPLIQLLVKYFKYLENSKVNISQENLTTFVQIFYKDNNDRYSQNLNIKLRNNQILPKNTKKWFLYDEINDYLGDNIQFSALEEETFQYIENYQEYIKKSTETISEFNNDWRYQNWEYDYDHLSEIEKISADEKVENSRKITNEKIQDIYIKNNISKIPSLIKKYLENKNIDHLEIVKQI